jgi:monoamine oxidase
VRCDVAIVGAGISGLACAAALAGSGITAVLFEARDIVGGRIRTYRPPDGGPALELGAQVIHGDRNPLRDLAGEGIPAAKSPRSHLVPRTAAARAVLNGRMTPLGALACGGAPPWVVEQRLTADGGGQADIPVASWLAAQLMAGDHLLAAAEWFRQNWAAELQALSARGVAAARRGDQTGDGEYAFEDGYVSLTDTLAVDLDIRLGKAVRTLAWEPGRVALTTGDGVQATARAAVITAPPPVIAAGRLAIAPMPERKSAAARALPSGDGVCQVATLSRAASQSAVVFDADGQGGFVRCTAGRPEVQIVAKARAAAAVRAANPADLAGRMFPEWAPSEVIGMQVADWGHDPWSAGVFSYPGVGAGWAGAAWAAPVQRTLFFAGEATTAALLPPTVHGALGSGLRAASEIVEAWGR